MLSFKVKRIIVKERIRRRNLTPEQLKAEDQAVEDNFFKDMHPFWQKNRELYFKDPFSITWNDVRNARR